MWRNSKRKGGQIPLIPKASHKWESVFNLSYLKRYFDIYISQRIRVATALAARFCHTFFHEFRGPAWAISRVDPKTKIPSTYLNVLQYLQRFRQRPSEPSLLSSATSSRLLKHETPTATKKPLRGFQLNIGTDIMSCCSWLQYSG